MQLLGDQDAEVPRPRHPAALLPRSSSYPGYFDAPTLSAGGQLGPCARDRQDLPADDGRHTGNNTREGADGTAGMYLQAASPWGLAVLRCSSRPVRRKLHCSKCRFCNQAKMTRLIILQMCQ